MERWYTEWLRALRPGDCVVAYYASGVKEHSIAFEVAAVSANSLYLKADGLFNGDFIEYHRTGPSAGRILNSSHPFKKFPGCNARIFPTIMLSQGVTSTTNMHLQYSLSGRIGLCTRLRCYNMARLSQKQLEAINSIIDDSALETAEQCLPKEGDCAT